MNAPPAPASGAPAASAENPTTAPSEVGSPTVPTGRAEVQPSGVTEAAPGGSGLPNPSEPYQVIPANGSATLDSVTTAANQAGTTGSGTAVGRGMMPGMGMGAGGMASPDRDRTALFHADAGEWGPGMGLPLALGRPEPPPEPEPDRLPARKPVPSNDKHDGETNEDPDGKPGPVPGRHRGRPGPNGRPGPAGGKPVPGKPVPGKPGPAPRGGKRNG